MSKCTASQETEAALEHRGDVTENTPSLAFSPEREQSPLLKALRSHFEQYQGLTEPKVDSRRPQTDDL